MTLPYAEGTWFGIPLRQGGYAVGLVARATKKGRVVLCYFFGPRRTAAPTSQGLERLSAQDAILIARVGDLSLMDGSWPIIKSSDSWRRSSWPVPPFVRRDDMTGTAWRVQYLDSDPNTIDYEAPISSDSELDPDRLLGSGAAELLLTRLLG